jgi:hypothetical protein
MTIKTNANSNLLAALLADAKVGTFTGLVTTKKGVERGPKGAKVRYGDDTVRVCIFTGFKYLGLVQRSLDMLATINDADMLLDATEDGVLAWSGRGKKAVQVALTAQDFADARAELVESFNKTLAGTNESTTDHVFEPLVLDGKVVRGARVYTGQTDAAIAAGVKAPATPGTIYLQGLQVSSRVLTPAANGPKPASKSAAKTVAKSLLTRRLPISRYVSYRLQPGTDFLLRAGGTAVLEAEKDGLHFTEAVRDALKRAA